MVSYSLSNQIVHPFLHSLITRLDTMGCRNRTNKIRFLHIEFYRGIFKFTILVNMKVDNPVII